MPKHRENAQKLQLWNSHYSIQKGVRTDARNYRPITLLNNDYKVLTRILARRMLRIITQCISDNQIGFMPRTFLAESTMLVKLIQAHLDTIDEGGLLVFLDLEKACDRVSWDFMEKSSRNSDSQTGSRNGWPPSTMKNPLLNG